MRGDADLDGARPLVHHLVDADLEHLVGAQRPVAQDHAVVEVVRRAADAVRVGFTTLERNKRSGGGGGDSLRPQRRSPVADDGGFLTAVGVEEQPVGPVRVRGEGQGGPGPAHVRRQRPHDGVVASEAVAVVVVVDYSDLDGHAVEVYHAVDDARRLGCRNAYSRKMPSCCETEPANGRQTASLTPLSNCNAI